VRGSNKTAGTSFRFLAPSRETVDPEKYSSSGGKLMLYISKGTTCTLVGSSQLDGSAAVAVAPQVPVLVFDKVVCMGG
jgi:hypothetical protein